MTNSLNRQKPLSRDGRGAVALMFAILVLPLIALIGLSVDVSLTMVAKSRMDHVAEAAAQAAAEASAAAFVKGATNYIVEGENVGARWFNIHDTAPAGMVLEAPVLTVSQAGQNFTASLVYNGSVATTVARYFGFPVFLVEGNRTATIAAGS